MIQLVSSEVLENCLDHSVVKQLTVSEPLDEAIMNRMARRGKLQYFPNFPRPYFRIDRNQAYVVQGVFGNTTMRVTFSPRADAETENELKALIETPLPAENDT
jgi:hypothetical protein